MLRGWAPFEPNRGAAKRKTSWPVWLHTRVIGVGPAPERTTGGSLPPGVVVRTWLKRRLPSRYTSDSCPRFAKLRLGTRPFDGRFANMTKKLVLGLACGLLGLGCSSSGEIICEKILDECHLADLFPGVSTEECAERLDKDMTESQGEDCASCIDEASCSTIVNGGCDPECSF
jgi:hypothetical protein